MDDEEFKRRIKALPKDEKKAYEDKLADIRQESFEKLEGLSKEIKESGKLCGLDGDREISNKWKKIVDETVDKMFQLKEEIIEDISKQVES